MNRVSFREVGLAVAILAGCSIAPAPTPMLAPDGLEVWGDFDYGWSVRTAGGHEVPLERYRGRVVVLNLWATWCPPCVQELASFEALARNLDGVDVALLLVSTEDPARVADFQARHELDLPLVTEATRASGLPGPLALPTTFVVDRNGRIVLRHQGAAAWDRPEVVAFLEALAREPGAGP